jgi:hypothetical protein
VQVPRRRALGIALGVAVVLAGLWWLLRPSAAPRAGEPAPDVAAEPPLAPAARRVAELPLDALPEPVRRFLESTPYPPTSGRLTTAHEDLLRPNSRYERHRPIPDTLGADPASVVTWLFSADHWSYVGPATVRAWLEVERGGKPAHVEVVDANAVREGADGPLGAPEPLHFVRDGDRLVTELPLASMADHFGPILLSVRFEYEPGRFHDDQLRIVSTPASHVPGQVLELSDRVSDGNLVLDLGVDLVADGFYRFDANVYDAAGNPVAFVSWKGDLPAGSQQVPLELWGKVLHDAGVPGPYTVGEIRGYRFLDGAYPDREMLPPVAGTHTTAPWSLDLFNDSPHVDAHEIQVAGMMLEDLEQGRAVVVPPVAAGVEEPRPPDDDAEPVLPE